MNSGSIGPDTSNCGERQIKKSFLLSTKGSWSISTSLLIHHSILQPSNKMCHCNAIHDMCLSHTFQFRWILTCLERCNGILFVDQLLWWDASHNSKIASTVDRRWKYSNCSDGARYEKTEEMKKYWAFLKSLPFIHPYSCHFFLLLQMLLNIHDDVIVGAYRHSRV